VAAECMLIGILRRARERFAQGHQLFSTPALSVFLRNAYTSRDFQTDRGLLDRFAELDDNDIVSGIKAWQADPDPVLSDLCRRILNRDLFRIEVYREEPGDAVVEERRRTVREKLTLPEEDMAYYFIRGRMVNNAYNSSSDKINILFKDGKVKDIADAADTLNIKALAVPVEKQYLCYPKEAGG
jgi:hypothetical protein